MSQQDDRVSVETLFISDALAARVRYFTRARAVFEYIEATPYDAITLAQAAQLAHMERCSFARFFKSKIGVTFQSFARRCKVSRAAAILQESDASISETAFALGFECMGTFARAFRSVTGVVPSDYRKRCLAARESPPLGVREP